ncbi:MAG: class I SAM-dependent methyltransferase [Pseudomonadota bacterium]
MRADPDFWTKLAPDYARRPLANTAQYEDMLERTRRMLGPDDHVVEIGCGTGGVVRALENDVAWIMGTDFSPGMVEIAERRSQDYDAEFAVAPADEIPAQDGTLDAVLAFNLLHLLDNPHDVLKAVVHALVPGGRFLSKTPLLREAGWLTRVPLWTMQRLGRAPVTAWLRQDTLDDMLVQAGFVLEETHTYPGKVPNRFVVAQKP